MWQIKYLGEGVVSNPAGNFQNGTMASVKDDPVPDFVRELQRTKDWRVYNAEGQSVGMDVINARAYHEIVADQGAVRDEFDINVTHEPKGGTKPRTLHAKRASDE